jgi:hypothetical protein
METLKRHGRKGFDRAKYEAEFDAFMNRQHAQTLGNLIKRTEGLANMDTQALNRRGPGSALPSTQR